MDRTNDIRPVAARTQRSKWSGSNRLAMLVTLTVVVGAATALGMQLHVPLAEMSHTADVILVGTVVDASARWGPTGKMIFTGVTFEDITLIRKKPGVAAKVSERMTLAFAGGQVGARGVSVSGVPTFEVGQRYVVFALMDGRSYVNPLIGGAQGLFRVEADAATGREYPLTARGAGVKSVSQGRLQLTRKLGRIDRGVPIETARKVLRVPAPKSSKGRSETAWSRRVDSADSILTLGEFIGEIQGVLDDPAPIDGVLSCFRAGGGTGTPALQGFSGEAGGRPPRDGMVPIGPEVAETAPTGLDEGMGGIAPLGGTSLCYCGNWELFLTMEQVPSSWDSYPENDYAMWMWNRFMDIYRVVPADGGVGNNDDNEFAGWMDNATLYSVYGSVWGASDLGLCITWYYGSACEVHGIDQADIIFNANATWSYDFEATFNNSGLVLYQPLVMHETGHSWGFIRGTCTEDYSYNRPSVMHSYYSGVVEDGRGIHSGDAWGIRNAYDSETSIISIRDIGVESYYADSGLINSTTDKTNYDAGESITIQNYSVENMSNTAVSNVRIRFFLSTDRTITTGDCQMGGWWEWASFAAEGFWVGDTVTTIPVVPTGTYWIGAIVTRNGASYDSDDYSANNSTFWPVQINVACYAPSTPIAVMASDGTYCDHVEITWYSAIHADQYRVYRDGVAIGSWQSGLSYDDYGTDAWEVCSYQVRARNQCGESGLSYPNDGHRVGIPSAPTNVQASDGISCNYVFVNWTAVRAADYIVIRDDMAISSWQENNNFYHYCPVIS